MSIATRLPLGLTLLRALLGVGLVPLTLRAPSAQAFGFCLTVGFLSDIFDGVIARRLGVATPTLRRLDSLADTIFYLAATFAVWHLTPAVILRHSRSLLALAALELVRYAVDLRKFGREASYHLWTSKVWGIVLFLAFFQVLVLNDSGSLVAWAIGLGIVADIEGLAISCVLAEWKSDVPSFVHALRLRAGVPRTV